jgi:hypothetical protein
LLRRDVSGSGALAPDAPEASSERLRSACESFRIGHETELISNSRPRVKSELARAAPRSYVRFVCKYAEEIRK